MGLLDPYNPAFSAIVLYIIFVLIIAVGKPNFLYDATTNKFRKFGSQPGETYFTVYVVAIVACIILYYVFSSCKGADSFRRVEFLPKYI